MTETYRERFVLLVPVGPADRETLRVRGFLVRALRNFLFRTYGAWTNGDAWGPAVVGQWRGSDGLPATDESIVLWTDVDVSRFDEALADFEDWRLLFQRHLRQELVYVSHFPVRTLGSSKFDSVAQLPLFGA